jgi:transketolase
MNYNHLIKRIIEVAYSSKEGHIPSSLSILDLLYIIYDNGYHNDLILSKGHAAIGLYVIMEYFGLLEGDLDSFCRNNSKLFGHPTHKIKNVRASTGSLGHGLPMGLGIAMARKITNDNKKIFVVIGDGEANEGTTWECALLASHHNLNNLCCILDQNNSSDRALFLGDIKSKFESFGWYVTEIDGHNHLEIKESLHFSQNKPHLILAKTIKGKGIKIMENNPEWHHKIPNEDEYRHLLENL